MNDNAISFDEAYNPDNDQFDAPHIARWHLIQAIREHPDMFKPLLD